MSDFLDDAPPPKSGAPKSGQAGGFDPFAGEAVHTPDQVQSGAAGAGGAGNSPFDAEEYADSPATATANGDGDTSVVMRTSDDDRASLWVCPHCGAKNKPKREVCRACGKHPDAAVKRLMTNPLVLGGTGLVIVAVLILLFTGGADLTKKPASLAGLDQELRLNTSGGPDRPIGNSTFTPAGGMALCARVLRVKSQEYDGMQVFELFLVFGTQERIADKDSWRRFKPMIRDDRIDLYDKEKPARLDEVGFCQIYLIDKENISIQAGQLISFTGYHGTVADWNLVKNQRRDEYIVLPTGMVSVSDIE